MRNTVKLLLVVLGLVGAWRSWVAPSDGGVRTTAPVPSVAVSRQPPESRTSIWMPDVTGLHHAFARYVLETTSLRLGDVRLKPSSKPWGMVLRQSIAPGASVRPSTRVDIVLAKGSVPPRCGLSWCAAIEPPSAEGRL